MINENELNNNLKSYDPSFDSNRSKLVQDEINSFNQHFPKKVIETLTKEKYVLGFHASDDTFSWWVEYGTSNIATIGGFASKHRLYFSRKNNDYKYPPKYRSADECFEDIKSNLIRLYELIEKDNLDDFNKIDLPHNQSIKISYLLNSQNFLPILDKVHLDKLCDELGITIDNLNSLQKNRRILDKFKSNEISRNWHTTKMMDFCYSKYGFDLKIKTAENNEDILFIKTDVSGILQSKKQIILYGPPGTGKTYNTKRIALNVLEK